MSELMQYFIAGQLHALRELTLFLAPNINSYKRFAAGRSHPRPCAGAATIAPARCAS
jgi:glutamine synthetase